MATLKCGSTVLPEPTELSSGDEIIWSSNAGRSAESGKMLGDVVASKKTLEVKWAWLTEAQVATIKNSLVNGFFPITFRDNGATVTITVYRGTLQKEAAGYIGDGTYYYKSVSVSLIQQ